MTYRPPKPKAKKMGQAHRNAIPSLSESVWVEVEKIASDCKLTPLEIVADMVSHCITPRAKKPRPVEA